MLWKEHFIKWWENNLGLTICFSHDPTYYADVLQVQPSVPAAAGGLQGLNAICWWSILRRHAASLCECVREFWRSCCKNGHDASAAEVVEIWNVVCDTEKHKIVLIEIYTSILLSLAENKEGNWELIGWFNKDFFYDCCQEKNKLCHISININLAICF